METMAPKELDNILGKLYAEVKKRDGDYYQRESLKIMQSAIERYLKEKNYSPSIVRSREFHKKSSTRRQFLCDKKELPPLVPINGVQQQGQMLKAMGFNPDFQAAGLARFPPSCPSQFQYRMEASSQNYTGCTYNFFSQENAMPQPQPQKKRAAYIMEPDDEDLTLKKTIFAVTRF